MASSALEKLRAIENLRSVWADYWSNAKKKVSSGVDGVTAKQFNDNLGNNLRLLSIEVAAGYSFSLLKGVPVPKVDSDKKRIICVPTIRDRIVQKALLRVIESKATALGIVNDVSFGFIKHSSGAKRGANAARDEAIIQRKARPWAFKADISAFFDCIPRELLISDFERKFRLRSLAPLMRKAINCEIDNIEPEVRRVSTAAGIKSGVGLRQGMPLSPILSNFLLRDFDLSFETLGYRMIRYADDLVVFAETEAECEKIKDHTEAELGKLSLSLSKQKTVICPPDVPVEFLGMELALKTKNDYFLRISEQQIARIKEAFTKFHDLDFVLSQNLDIADLLKRLNQKRIGFKAAYGAADNFDDLSTRLDQYVNNAGLSIYRNIFGSSIIDKLKPQQRKFLRLS